MQTFHPFARSFLAAGALILLALAACAPRAAGPTTAAATAGPTVPAATPLPTQTPTPPPVNPGSVSPDWTGLGFPTVLATQELAAGAAATIKAGPYTIDIPAGAFSGPVRFTLLSGDPTHFADKAPAHEQPILAFALNVLDTRANLLIQDFDKPLQLTISDPRITSQVKYYNIGPDGAYGPDPEGLQVSAGKLTHPLSTAGVGRVITAPKP